jgi:hypothetical protein
MLLGAPAAPFQEVCKPLQLDPIFSCLLEYDYSFLGQRSWDIVKLFLQVVSDLFG